VNCRFTEPRHEAPVGDRASNAGVVAARNEQSIHCIRRHVGEALRRERESRGSFNCARSVGDENDAVSRGVEHQIRAGEDLARAHCIERLHAGIQRDRDGAHLRASRVCVAMVAGHAISPVGTNHRFIVISATTAT